MNAYKVGESVQATYFHNGTVLGPGVVESVSECDGGWSVVSVRIAALGDTRSYHVSPTGHSDYLTHDTR